MYEDNGIGVFVIIVLGFKFVYVIFIVNFLSDYDFVCFIVGVFVLILIMYYLFYYVRFQEELKVCCREFFY